MNTTISDSPGRMTLPYLILLSAVICIAGIAAVADAPWSGPAMALSVIPVLSLLALNRERMLIGIVLVLFLEAKIFSVSFLGARIRAAQALEVLGGALLLAGLLMRRFKMKSSPIDKHIGIYLLVNLAAVFNATWSYRSIKVFLLLLSLALLYILVLNLITSPKAFDRAFRWLLFAGAAEISYGLYQVAAAIFNLYRGTHLPVGYMGVIHADFIGSPWGRPYGTFVEPDWYGAICMFFALVFMYLYYSLSARRRSWYFTGLMLSLAGLALSFVRAAWLGFLFGAFLYLFNFARKRITRISPGLYFRRLFWLTGIVAAALALSAPLRTIVRERFYSGYTGSRFTMDNVRVQFMKISCDAFLQSPVIGNGPGSAAFLQRNDREAHEDRQETGFNPSLVFTIMEDTGVLGLFAFFLLLYAIVKTNLSAIPRLAERYMPEATALFCALGGLCVSYLFNQGLWLPFTWVFLAFNMAILRVGRRTDAGLSGGRNEHA